MVWFSILKSCVMMVVVITINDYCVGIAMTWFHLGIEFYTSPMQDLRVEPLTVFTILSLHV